MNRQSAGIVTAEICNGRQYRDVLLLKKKWTESFKAVNAEQQWRKKLKPKRKKKRKKNSWFEVGLYSSEANKILQN